MARRILLVEDDNDLRRMFRIGLTLEGFEVTEAVDGLKGLQRLDRSLPPDLIILDLAMPVVSGHAVVHEVSAYAHLRHIPIIIVTGSSEDLDHLEVACVLRKPVSAADLTDAVRRSLDSASPPSTS